MKLMTSDRKDLAGFTLQAFIAFTVTVSSALTLFFVVCLLSRFHVVSREAMHLMVRIGMPVLNTSGVAVGWPLYRFYNREQAHRRSIMENISYDEALLPDCPALFIVDFLFLFMAFDLLMEALPIISLSTFWLIGAICTAIFIAGCIVMVNVALIGHRWHTERTSMQGLWLR